MKRIFTILVAMAAFLAAENTADAQLLKNLLNKVKGNTTETTTTTTATETVAPATSDGQAAGVALKALYGQYKADGKLDMSNLTNLMNLAALATSVQNLKGQTDKTTFYKDFVKGLISGSNNLVNADNSTSIMSGLQNLVNNVDLSGLTASAEEKAESAAATLTEKLTGASEKANTAVENATEIAGAVTNILNLFKK
jgi:hypothetical protein